MNTEAPITIDQATRTALETVQQVAHDPVFEQLQEQVNEIVAKAATMSATTDEEANAAGAFGAEAVAAGKKIDKTRLAWTKPLRDMVDVMNEAAAKLTDPLKAVVERMRKLTNERAKAREIEAEEARIREQEAQDAIASAAADVAEPDEPPPPPAPKVETPTVSKKLGSSVQTRKVWKSEITNAGDVPRIYCEPSGRLIRAAVDAGVHEIAGVRIWQETESAFTRARS